MALLQFERFDGPPGTTLVIAHGLFGSARNWRSLARKWALDRPVIALDMRNHGESPHFDTHDYPALAADLAETISHLSGGAVDVLGHSMGGKSAMWMALVAPDRLRRLIIADIAPVTYTHSHGDLIAAMRDVDLSKVQTRKDAETLLSQHVDDAGIRAFLLQSLSIEHGQAKWVLNLEALDRNMSALTGFPASDSQFDGPALFLRGELSDYVLPEHHDMIRSRFPNFNIADIAQAGHWLHAERPQEVFSAVNAFLKA